MKETDRLIRMKEEMDTASNAMTKAEGRLEQLEKSLADDYGHKSVKAAERERDKQLDQLDKDKDAHEQDVAKLEKAYDWEGV